jgi:hypothetical protein
MVFPVKTIRTFNEGVDRLHEAHAKVCAELATFAELADKLLHAARLPETVDALTALQSDIHSMTGGLESAQHNIGRI